MVVEPAEHAANDAQHAVTNTVAVDSGSTRHSETTNQVNDFLSSYAGSNCGSEEESETSQMRSR
jgi:hypothetical protein